MAANGILAQMSVVLSGEISGFQRSMAQAKRELAGFVKAGAMLKGVGESLTTYLSAPLALVGAGALKVGGDFESGMNRVQAATLATGKELADLKAKAKDIALDPRLKFSAQDAAGALEALAKNGVSTTDILGGAADAAVNLSTATGGQLAQSADIATDVMQNFGKKAGELAGVVDSITGATIASKFGIEDYAGALAQAGAVSGQLGVSFEDFNTAISATSSGFSSGSDAGTSFKTFLQRLNPASKEAAAAMQKLGLKFFDAQGQMKPLREIAGDLQKAFKGLSDQQRNELGTEIFGADSIRTALLLAKQGTEGFDKMAESIGKVKAASQGAILSQGFSGALEAFKSSLEGLGIAIAESGLLEFGTRLLKGAADLVSSIARADPALLRMGVVIAGIAAAVGPALVAIGSLGAALPALSAGFAVLGLSTGPIGLALAGVAAAAYLIIDNWDDLVAYFTTGRGGKVFGDLATSISRSVGSIVSALGALVGSSSNLGELVSASELIKNVFEELAIEITAFADTVTGIVNTVVKLFSRDFTGALDDLGFAAEALTRPLRNLLGLTREVIAPPANEGLSDYFAKLTNDALGTLQPIQDVTTALATQAALNPGGSKSSLTEDQISALEKLREELRQNELRYQALGDQYDVVANKQRILQSGIESLIGVGFKPLGQTVQGFVRELLVVPSAIDKIETDLTRFLDRVNETVQKASQKEFNPLGQLAPVELPAALPVLVLPPIDTTAFSASVDLSIAELQRLYTSQFAAEQFTEGLNQILVGGLQSVAVGVAEAIGQMAIGAGGIDAVATALLTGIGNMAVQLGQMAIGVGIAVSGIKAALETLNPVVAIAAGVALVALGSAVKGAAAKISKGKGSTPAASVGGGYTPRSASPVQREGQQPVTVTHNVVMVQQGKDLVGVLTIEQTRRGQRTGG